jgi:hypothetical protein
VRISVLSQDHIAGLDEMLPQLIKLNAKNRAEEEESKKP